MLLGERVIDGYIVGTDGEFDWSVPDEEVVRAHIEEIRDVGVHLMGRRLYETMLYWETAEQDPSLDDAEREWTAPWKPLPKVVFSSSLSSVQGNARLAAGDLAEEIERLRAESAEGDKPSWRDSCRAGCRAWPDRRVPRMGLPRPGRRRRPVLRRMTSAR